MDDFFNKNINYFLHNRIVDFFLIRISITSCKNACVGYEGGHVQVIQLGLKDDLSQKITGLAAKTHTVKITK